MQQLYHLPVDEMDRWKLVLKTEGNSLNGLILLADGNNLTDRQRQLNISLQF